MDKLAAQGQSVYSILAKAFPKLKFDTQYPDTSFPRTSFYITCVGSGITVSLEGGQLAVQFGGLRNTRRFRTQKIRTTRATLVNTFSRALDTDVAYKKKVSHQRQQMRRHIAALQDTKMFECTDILLSIEFELYGKTSPRVVAHFPGIPDAVFSLVYTHYNFRNFVENIRYLEYGGGTPPKPNYSYSMGAAHNASSNFADVIDYLDHDEPLQEAELEGFFKHIHLTEKGCENSGKKLAVVHRENLSRVAAYLLHANATDARIERVDVVRKPKFMRPVDDLMDKDIAPLFPPSEEDIQDIVICSVVGDEPWPFHVDK